MNRDQVTRNDFPSDGSGYDRASVDAHLAAVAAWTTALEAQIAALEVEREALRRSAAERAAQAPADQPPDTVAQPGSGTRARDAEAGEPEPERVEPEPMDPGPVEADPAPDEPEPAEPEVKQPETGSDAEVSARLVATKMALDGSGRDEIVAHLDASYDLPDAGGVVDDVLARLG